MIIFVNSFGNKLFHQMGYSILPFIDDNKKDNHE
jgi:hypothetical protein